MKIDGAPYDVRVRPRWGRGLVLVALVLLPVAVIEWPWEFLPIRWQYGEIREAERVIEIVEGLKAKSGHLPTEEELTPVLQQAQIPTDYYYEAHGDEYSMLATASFDWVVVYDSRTRTWQRKP